MDKSTVKKVKVKFTQNYEQYKSGKTYDVPTTLVPYILGYGLAEKVSKKNEKPGAGSGD